MNSTKTQAIIFDFNRTIFNPDTSRLMHGARNLLEYAHTRYDCYLLSFDEHGRNDLINQLGIEKYFTGIKFVKEKTKANMRSLTKQKRYKNIYVIGDRVKKEITLGNALGYETIWLNKGKFKKESPSNAKEIPRYTILSLKAAIEIL